MKIGRSQAGTQRKHMIKFLRDAIRDLEKSEPSPAHS
jgi:hypothetical protein